MGLGREQLAADRSTRGRALCAALSDRADAHLAELFTTATDRREGVALVALGGYGRRELSLQSDLDVLLLHDGRAPVDDLAEAIWYPLWDEGHKLGHGVRTPTEALALAAEDLDSATATLQARHIAGDAALSTDLRQRVEALWVDGADRFLGLLVDRVRERHERAGEVAFLLEPDLKDGRGGLRDVHSLHWAARARPSLWAGDEEVLAAAHDVLLDARVELHRRTGRAGDRLLLQDQDAVAAALGCRDADELMRHVSEAARAIAFRSDDAWRRIDHELRGSRSLLARWGRTLGPDLVERDGQLRLSEAADLTDPVLPLRVAAIGAEQGVPLHRAALAALEPCPPLPCPWPDGARHHLVRLLATGRPAIGHLEALDQHGLLAAAVPGWAAVRSRPQRNALHTFTVDRHLCEAAAGAAALVGRVARPDLLLVGAWLHDIGKGAPGDHTAAGMALVADIGARMGFPADDVADLVVMVEHHLLLADVATRRDLDDPEVIEGVATLVATRERLRLLHALTEADACATGPAAWSPWKADLVARLVRRVDHVLGGGEADDVTVGFPTPEQAALAAGGERVLRVHGDTLTVVDADRSGLFSRVTGTLALHALDVLHADIATVGGRALEVLTVRAGVRPPRWPDVLADLERALDGRLALRARLADRAASYRRRTPSLAAPRVEFQLDASRRCTVVDVHAPDSVGLLHRIATAIAELDLDIVRARAQTQLDEVVDSFYVEAAGGGKVPEDVLPELRRALLHAVEPPA